MPRLRPSFAVLLLCALAAPLGAAILRGPYIQGGAANFMFVKWRTDQAGLGKVCYGTDPAALKECRSEKENAADHEVRLDGLQPNTRYYYSFDGQAAPGQFFVTAPLTGTAKDTRLWILGDAGTADENPKRVLRSWLAYNQGQPADLVLQMGDNAYTTGTDAQYQRALFQVFTEPLKNHAFWSCLGNHETYNGDPILPYEKIFNFPTQGELGGLPSGTERYYSFNYANIHFVTLDPNDKAGLKPGSAMLRWLEKDLGANTQTWTVAFSHQPPYTKGSHDSDLEEDLIALHQNVAPILEAGGVDLMLNGHSHAYERGYLVGGHYGASKSFDRGKHLLDAGDKKLDGADLYSKPLGKQAHAGTVYVVAGCSAKADGGPLNHPAMKRSFGDRYGSMVIDVKGTVLSAAFLADSGEILDRFAIAKGPLPSPTPSFTVTPYAGTPTHTPTVTLTATHTPTAPPTATPGPVYSINSFDDADLNSQDQNDRGLGMGEGNSSKSVAYVNGAMTLEYYTLPGNNYTWWYSSLDCLRADRYDVLELRVRGLDGGEKFDVFLEAVDGNCKGKDRASVHIEDYATLTKQWQKLSIPLADFKKLKSRALASVLLMEFRAGKGVQVDEIRLLDSQR